MSASFLALLDQCAAKCAAEAQMKKQADSGAVADNVVAQANVAMQANVFDDDYVPVAAAKKADNVARIRKTRFTDICWVLPISGEIY